MLKPYDEIVKLLKENSVEFQELNHEPVYTSEEAARVRGMEMQTGAKSLLLKTDKEFVLVVIPGSTKLDTKKLRQVIKVHNIRFAKPDEVIEVMGCAIGACYPFGQVCGVKMLVDKSLSENECIWFNPGVHNKSIQVKYEDFKNLGGMELVSIVA